MSTVGEHPDDPRLRSLAYLLKHAHLAVHAATTTALSPLDIDGRDLAVLADLGREPGSQQEVARRLGVDRTTMVSILDVLQEKSLIDRRPDQDDRRRNVVVLTATGVRTLRRGTVLQAAAEQEFLDSLDESAATQLRRSLVLLNTAEPAAPPDPHVTS